MELLEREREFEKLNRELDARASALLRNLSNSNPTTTKAELWGDATRATRGRGGAAADTTEGEAGRARSGPRERQTARDSEGASECAACAALQRALAELLPRARREGLLPPSLPTTPSLLNEAEGAVSMLVSRLLQRAGELREQLNRTQHLLQQKRNEDEARIRNGVERDASLARARAELASTRGHLTRATSTLATRTARLEEVERECARLRSEISRARAAGQSEGEARARVRGDQRHGRAALAHAAQQEALATLRTQLQEAHDALSEERSRHSSVMASVCERERALLGAVRKRDVLLGNVRAQLRMTRVLHLTEGTRQEFEQLLLTPADKSSPQVPVAPGLTSALTRPH